MYGRWGSNTRLIFPGSRIDAAAPQPNLALPQCIGQQSLQIVDFAAPPWPGFACPDFAEPAMGWPKHVDQQADGRRYRRPSDFSSTRGLKSAFYGFSRVNPPGKVP